MLIGSPDMKLSKLLHRLIPRFSLRAMFVVITLLAILLGWQLSLLRQRRSYLKEHPSYSREPGPKDIRPTAPRLLWMWGEQGQFELSLRVPGFADGENKTYHHKHPPAAAVEARKLFPEAIICVLDGERVFGESTIVWNTWFPGKKWQWGKAESDKP
jgi:hypothetical protein